MKRANKKNEFSEFLYKFFYINKQIKENFGELQKKWKETVDRWNIAAQRIMQAQKSFQLFIKQIAELDKGLAKVEEVGKEIMLEAGWWITPSLMEVPLDLIMQALVDYKKNRKNAITNLFKKIYHHNNYHYLKETVKSWRKNPFFESRMQVIEDALDAHCQRKYTLSIPALLPVAEGIATEFCQKVKIYDQDDRSRGKKKIKKAIKYKDVIERSLHLELLINAIDEIIFKDTELLIKAHHNYKNLLNRHAVLHGIQKNYATPKNSLQCFMLLDVLSRLKS